MKKTIFSVLLSFCFFFGFAQNVDTAKEWTLQQCIEEALKNNIRVKQTRLNALSAREQYSQNIGQALPDLNGSATHVYNFGRTIDPFTNTFATDRVLSQNFSLSSSVTLFAGFQTLNTISQGRFAYLAAISDIRKTENDIALAVASGYLQILFNLELVENFRKQINLTQEQVARTKKLVDAGSLALGNLYEIEAQQAREELDLVNAENQLQLSYIDLAQLMNLDDVMSFRISRPVLEIPQSTTAVTMEMAYQSALTGMPEIKAGEQRLRSAEKGLNAAKGGISPRLTAFGSLGTGYSGANREIEDVSVSGYDTAGVTVTGVPVLSPRFDYNYIRKPFKDQLDDNFNRSIGLRLTVPFLNGFQNRTTIRRARIQMQSADLSLQETKLTVRKEVQKAYLDANGALKKFNASTKALNAMQESFKYTKQRFDVGMLNSFDFNSAKTSLAKAESDLLQAKYEYIFKLKVLDFYQGKPLTF